MKNNEQEMKIAYLQMIQAVIERMSTISAIVKGFCATTVSGIIMASFSEISKWGSCLALILVFSFVTLDVYYLWLERRFRALYDMVLKRERDIDFSLRPPKEETGRDAFVHILSCFKSPAIWLFYLPAGLIATVFVIMKFKGVE